ncbi:MAG: DUF3307 domain-containing protein [Alteromonadaceae bacterium]|nr:DUF3307 domain-containing protein [Alteromonadaceae bacterium]
MELLMLLLTAHFIGDFYAQPKSWVECRNTNHYKSKGLWKHFLVHILLYLTVFLMAESTLDKALTAVAIISISHVLTDLWKSYRTNNLFYFLIDQLIHILLIVIVWIYLSGFTFDQVVSFTQNFITTKHLIIAIAYILVCKPASVVISLALKKHTDSLNTETTNSGLASAGTWIGYLERCLAISFIFMGQFAGIGFLVATKTIFRFGDLTKNNDMKLTEYMMLGTLLSYAIALLIGWNSLLIYKASLGS